MIELKDVPRAYHNGCMCCGNMVGLKELLIGSQKNRTATVLCQLCRTALVGQLVEVR